MAIRNLVAKITAVSLVSSMILFAFSCGDRASKVTFFIDYEWEALIPNGSAISVPFEVWTAEQATDAEAKFGANGTESAFVIDVFAKTCTLDISSPSGQNLDFMNSLEVLISANGLQDTMIATKQDGIPENGLKSLSLTLSHNDFVHYIKKDNFRLLLRATTDQTIEQDIGVKIYTEFEVIANSFD